MKKTVVLYKKVGQTPLEVLKQFQEDNPEYLNQKLAYAGRLDPMAEGKLLVLVGDECKERDKYLSLDKEYEFEVVLGFKSDSQDVLGFANFDKKFIEKESKYLHFEYPDLKNKLSEIKNKFMDKQNFEYPAFSSKTVKGKPLFLWALENRLDEIHIPKKEIEIYSLKNIDSILISKNDLEKNIFEKINSVKEVKDESKALGADFRRGEIRSRWKNIFEKFSEDKKFLVLKFRTQVSSGAYMRVLAEKIGKEFGTHGLAYSIKRTKIGKKGKIFFRQIN